MNPSTHVAEQPLYGEQTRLTLQNMSFSGVPLSRFPAYIQSAARVKKACALANLRAGLLPADKAEQIMSACDELAAGRHQDQFPVDVYHGGGGIGLNMNLNEVIASLAGADIRPVDDVNMSQSTSDVCHTALRLTLFGRLGELDKETAAWVEKLEELASAFASVPTIARTCLQDGMEISAGALFSGTAAAIRRQREDIALWRKRMTRVNLGWTVVGTGTGAPESYRREILPALKDVLGYEVTWRESPLDAAEYPDDLAAVSGLTGRLAQILTKFSRDLRLLSSGPETGLRELRLPAVQAGSSFFPGKVNPVIPEMMIQCAMLIEGHDGVIQRAVGLGEIHINLWEEMMGFLLLDSMGMLLRAMVSLRERCVAGITINETVCREYAASRIPIIVACKERYGYQYLSSRIKKEGLEAVVADLRNRGAGTENS